METTSFAFAGRAVVGAALTLALSACMSSSPYWDAHFGQAARASAAVQIIHPDAGDHAPAQEKFDGRTAVSAMNQYDKAIAGGNAGTAAMGSTISSGISSGTTSGSQ